MTEQRISDSNSKKKLTNQVGVLSFCIRTFSILFLFISLSGLLASCGEQPLYSEHSNIVEPWAYADSIIFHLPAPDTSQGYGMVLNLSHTTEYPFENIYLKIGTTFPSGRFSSALLNLDLADKSGAWYGDCSGAKCKRSVPLREYFAFSEAGSYTISMQQYTRSENLAGVQGLELELWRSFQE